MVFQRNAKGGSQVEIIGWVSFEEVKWGEWSNKWLQGNMKCKNKSTKEGINYRINTAMY